MKTEKKLRKLRDFLIEEKNANPVRFMKDKTSIDWLCYLTWVLEDYEIGVS